MRELRKNIRRLDMQKYYELPDQLRKRVFFTYLCEEIRRHPEKFDIMKFNFEEMKERKIPLDPMYYVRLEDLINSGLDNFCNVLTERSERGHDLRQVMPCYRIATEPERMYIMQNYKALGEDIDSVYDKVKNVF